MGRPVGTVVFVAALLAAAAGATRAQQPPQQPQQTPVFRTATNFVQVDAYPTRNGRIVEGLTAKDFQVFEDGKPQVVESFEFVRIEPNTPEAFRRDPNSREEGNRLVADPRNRVFLLYLDHYHGTLAGSYAVRQPIVTMLNRMLAPNDLFGVATPRMRPGDLVFGRKTETIEDQLTRNWAWGKTDGTTGLEEDELGLVNCYGNAPALQIIARLREDKTLENLGLFIRHLGNLREARKVLLLFTGGWPLFEPDERALNALLGPDNFGKQQIYGGPGGRISLKAPNVPGYADWGWCAGEAGRAYHLNNRRRFRQLVEEANRANVSFYPVSMNGLVVGAGQDMFHELAENTDGIPVVTNDISAGLKKVTDDVSAFYLLGYYSTNAGSDGRYHRIDVKLSQPGVIVKARRGYTSPSANAETAPVGSGKPAPPEGVTSALDVLARLRPDAALFTYGVVVPDGLRLVVELPAAHAPSPEWERGADVQIARVGEAGGGPIAARIEPGSRAAAVTVPRPAGDPPYRFTIRVSAGRTVLNDRLDVAPGAAAVVGEALLYRAAPSPRAAIKPVANFQFWRTERIVIDWPRLATLERREARLLGRDGRPLPVPVTLTERDVDGVAMLTANLNLAPLAPGDYVIELNVAAGASAMTKYVGIRVLR